MTHAVIVSTARTPLAKSWKGAFNQTHGATLGGHAVQHAISRAGLQPDEVEDVMIGCAFPEGATGNNIARQIALRAGCPVRVPASRWSNDSAFVQKKHIPAPFAGVPRTLSLPRLPLIKTGRPCPKTKSGC